MEEKALLLSIVVPIYNVEKYLCKCIDSLLDQDLPKEQYEIILVDDGSPDRCGEIADRYATSNENIRVIHQENGGLSAARNTGIDAAKGEYLCFVDSDDYWKENVLSELISQIARDHLDVLRFKWQNVRESGEVFYPYKGKNNFNDYSSSVIDGLTFLNERMSDQCYAWMFVIKKELCEQEQFTEGILFEDTDWTPRMLISAERVTSTDTIVYNYLWRETGITLSRSKEKTCKELEDKIKLVKKLKTRYKGVWYDRMIASLMLSIVGILSSGMWNERKVYLNQIKKLDLIPLKIDKNNYRKAIKILLINTNIYLSLHLFHIMNR